MNNIRKMNKQGGFTLIELMIVIAILAILMAIAIPAYQTYTVRAEASEGMVVASAAKATVSENLLTGSGTDDCAGVETGAIGNTTISCTGGTIGVSVATDAGPTVAFSLEPTLVANSGVTWKCTTSGSAQYVPSECRGT